MEDENRPCAGCKRILDFLQVPRSFKNEHGSYNLSETFVLHASFESFVSAVKSRCKLCNYARVSCMKNTSDQEFFQTQPPRPIPPGGFIDARIFVTAIEHADNRDEGEESDVMLELDVILMMNSLHAPLKLDGKIIWWKFKSDSADPAIRVRSVSTTTTVDSDLQFFKESLSSCVQNHPKCSADLGGEYLPTRLLFVGTEEDPCLKIVRTEKWAVADRPRYATLSHCWGNRLPSKLLQSNMTQWEASVPESNLPRTFMEAIQAVRYFELQYLWIDALCIIQDSAEDWHSESAKMCDVYRGSYVTIAATGATDGSQGLFPHRRRDLDPCVTVEVCLLHGGIRRYVLHDYMFDVHFLNREPLSRRGWAVQERYLSRRMLHFASSQMAWECMTHLASQTYPDGLIRKDLPEMKSLLLSLEGQYDPSDREHWQYIVHYYSRCRLTKPCDKLIAISGLASHFQRRTGWQYLAGLWTFDLARHLLWSVGNDVESRREETRLPEWRAPSWSWASVDTLVIYHASSETLAGCLVDIDDFGVVPVASDPMGQLSDAWIDLRGELFELILKPDAKHGFDVTIIRWPSREDVMRETNLHIEKERLLSNPEKRDQGRIIRRATKHISEVEFRLDCYSITRELTAKPSDGAFSAWWLPIAWLDCPMVQGLILRERPGGYAATFERIGDLSVGRDSRLYHDASDAIAQQMIGKSVRGELECQSKYRECFSKRRIRIV